MRHSTISRSWPRSTLLGLAAAFGLVLAGSAAVTPAHGGEYYDRYDHPHRYSEDYDRPRYIGYERPHRYADDYYDRPYRYRPRLRCYECGCGWRCGTPSYHRYYPTYVRHAPYYHDSIIERRYTMREYVERRYAAPWRGHYRPRSYVDDVDDVPRPPAAIPGYYDDE
jgi:hypothetical protein